MNEAKEILLEALRQYQHNDGSGLVMGYDKEDTQRIVAGLQAQLAEAERERDEALVKLAVTSEEMGMQKAIVKELCVLLGVQIIDGHSALCVSAAEEALAALKRRVGAEAVRKVVNELERPDVPLAPSEILNYDLLDFAKRIESGEVEL